MRMIMYIRGFAHWFKMHFPVIEFHSCCWSCLTHRPNMILIFGKNLHSGSVVKQWKYHIEWVVVLVYATPDLNASAFSSPFTADLAVTSHTIQIAGIPRNSEFIPHPILKI